MRSPKNLLILFSFLVFPASTAFSQCADSTLVNQYIENSYSLREQEDVAGAKIQLGEALKLTSAGSCLVYRLWVLSEQLYYGHFLQDFDYLALVSAHADELVAGQSIEEGSQEEELLLIVRQYQATFLYEAGQYEQAYSAYGDIFRLLENREPLTYEGAKSLENATLYRASILKVWGEAVSAREWYLKSLDYSQACQGFQPLESVKYLTYKHIGDCFLLQGQRDQAISFYRQGYFSLRRFLRQHPGETPRLVNRQATLLDALAGYFLETQQYDSAWTYLSIGLRLNASPEMATRLRMREASYLQGKGLWEEALQSIAQTLDQRKAFYGPRHVSVAQTLLLKSELQVGAGRLQAALHTVREAKEMLADGAATRDLIRALDLQSELLWEVWQEEPGPETQAFLEEAFSCISQAMDLLDTLGRSYLEPRDKRFLVDRSYPLYERAILISLAMDVLQPGKGHAEEAFLWAEKSKAILLNEFIRRSRETAFQMGEEETGSTLRHQIAQLRDQLETELDRRQPVLEKIRSLRNELAGLNTAYDRLVSGNALPAILPAQMPDIGTIQRELLGKNEGLLEYFLGDRFLVTFLLTSDGLQVKSVSRPEGLNEQIQEWVQSISHYYDLKGDAHAAALKTYQDGGSKFYRLLVGPVENQLPEQLWIIPDGALALLPFEALLTREVKPNDENFSAYPFWIREKVLAFGFSASSLLEQQSHPNKRAPRGLLAVAPEFAVSGSAGQPLAARLNAGALYFNIPQARSICRSWRGDSLLNEAATEAQFLEKASQYRILHLATHGQANLAQGERSFLLLGGGLDTLFAWELMTQSFPAEMVVLSACETGAGQLRRGEGVVSLAWSFAAAGARSVVTSLWSVYDRSTALLMEEFYARLAQKSPKNQALHDAKMALLHNPEYAHPVHWAAFVAEGKMDPLQKGEGLLSWDRKKNLTMLNNIVQHTHSGLRWILLILLLWTIYSAFKNWQGGAAFTDDDRKRGLFTMIAAHVQLLLGLVLYFTSSYVKFTGDMMKDPLLRFYSVEHIFMMLIAITLITLGYVRAQKKESDTAKFKTQFFFLFFALLIILAAIPWPFREGLSGAWF
ncbi:MAG: CHAT domain-containing protein [Saprospirales bacterium]|nr:CHAT domain-containing protein [Saprospirales bacterium]